MFGLASASSSPSGVQLSLYQAKLQQARREVAQAQTKVQSLEAQTEDARQEAAHAADKARALEGQPLRRGGILNTQGQTTGRLLDMQV